MLTNQLSELQSPLIVPLDVLHEHLKFLRTPGCTCPHSIANSHHLDKRSDSAHRASSQLCRALEILFYRVLRDWCPAHRRLQGRRECIEPCKEKRNTKRDGRKASEEQVCENFDLVRRIGECGEEMCQERREIEFGETSVQL